MKLCKFIILLLCIGIFVTNSHARKYEFNGAGGFSIGIYDPELDFLDNKIQAVTRDFDKIEGPIYMWGQFGYAQVSDHWRIGGFGFGGERIIFGTYPDPNNLDVLLPQDVMIGAGGGG